MELQWECCPCCEEDIGGGGVAIHGWDYRVTYINVNDLADRLNDWGKRGWELVICAANGVVRECIFKRPTYLIWGGKEHDSD